jgi:hypothetical protein
MESVSQSREFRALTLLLPACSNVMEINFEFSFCVRSVFFVHRHVTGSAGSALCDMNVVTPGRTAELAE